MREQGNRKKAGECGFTKGLFNSGIIFINALEAHI